MEKKSNAAMWAILYIILAAFIILALLPLFGVHVATALLNLIYIVITVLLVLSIVHWLRLI